MGSEPLVDGAPPVRRIQVTIARGAASGKTALPFGTLLAPAAMAVLLWGEGWKNAYLVLFAGG